MQVSLETTSTLERKMTVEVPAEKISTAMEKRLQNMSRQVKISGFRPGKVPMRVVRQRFGKQVYQEVLADTMQTSYQEAINQESLRPAGSPQIEPLSIEADQDLKYVATFEVYPEIELADATKFEIEVADVEISENDIDNMIEKLRKQKIHWKSVDRKSKDQDQITIDFKGMIEGEEFAGGSQENFSVVLGSSTLLPDFEKQLHGVKEGEEKSFDIVFPKDYVQQEIAEKTATFNLNVKKVEQGELPDVDEKLIKEFGIQDGKLESLKQQLKDNLNNELAQRKKIFEKEQVMKHLFEANNFELPNSMLKQEIQALRKQSMENINIKDESLLPDSMFEEEAIRRISLGLIVGEIIQQKEIKLDSEKVNAHLNTLASSYTKPEEVIKYYRSNPQAMANIEVLVMEEQVVDWVMEKAKQVKKSYSFDEFTNKPT